MSNIKIHIKINHETGLRDITIEYESDADALPIEHEQRHMEIVHELVDTGVLKAEDVGEIIISRIGENHHSTEIKDEKTPGNQEETGISH
ncbi:MAG: hypothetical protein K8S87_04350 [Planctomycetes bacterium]|nr:hypothetical protein [Planctomycetota bacterium]